MNNLIKAYFLAICGLFLAFGSQGLAQQAAVTVDDEGIFSGQTFSIGWEFEVDSPITVSAFGRIITGALSADSEIRLYRLDTGAEVGSATIPQSTSGESAGAFYLNYFVDLPSAILLDPGIRYLIAAEALNGDGFLQDTPATLSSPIRFLQGRAADFGQPLPSTANATTFPIERNVSGVSYLGPTFRFTNAGNGPDPLTITSLDPRSVFQRDEVSGSASLPISGILGSDPVTRVEARAVPTDGGVAVDWTTIDSNPGAGSFSGNLTVSGGRYRIEARAFDANGIRYTGSASLIGVGDVYVVAGQSNAANFGESLQSASDDRVSTINLETNVWLPANDPMPNAGGNGGSPWPRLGDLLVAQANVPIAIITVAQGGTRVDQWLPGEQLYTQQLLRALDFVRTNSGVRAVLWHQGESDSASGTSSSAYTQRLQSIIAQSRIDSGINLPWGVALASADPAGNASTEAAIVAGQQAVIDADSLVFQGASTNDFGGLGLLFDGVHFSNAGLNEHAARWSQQITEFFGNGSGSGSSSAVNLTGEGIVSDSSFTVGWEFNVTNDTTVTRLGRVIPLGTSLGADSPVAIYNFDTGAQVASATIAQATTGEPINAFHQGHYATLATPVTLTTGANYVVLAEALDGASFFQDVPGTTATGINYIQGRATNPGEGLPATANEASLPIARNEIGLSYFGATFDTSGGTTPPPPPTGGSGNAVTTTGEGIFSNDSFSVGWEFTVSGTTEVDKLGRVTRTGESFNADSSAAIYRLDTGAQVASATISSAIPGEALGSVYDVHYATLATPVTLLQGINYVVLVEAMDGAGFDQDVPAVVQSGINYIAGRAANPGLGLPALGTNGTLPIVRDAAGVSYLGAMFSTVGDTTPPPVDTTPPSVTLAGPNTTSGSYSVSIAFSETVSGLSLGDVDVSNGTASGLSGSNSNYTINISPLTEGLVTVSLPSGSATDAAGNANTAAAPVSTTFSVSPPPTSSDLPWIETFDGLANGATSDNGDTAWSSSRNDNHGVNADQFRILEAGGTAEWQSEELQIGGATVSLSLDLQAAGQLEADQDFINVIALIDGTETVLATRQGLFNEGNTDRINVSGLSGQTLQIIIRALTTGSSEVYTWDNISVINQNAPVLELEAEDGVLQGLVIGSDSAASGGAFVHLPNNGSNSILSSPNANSRADYTFNVDEAGSYQIRGTILAATGSDNSFYITVDGQPSTGYLWDTVVSSTYTDDLVNDRDGDDPIEVLLSQGSHTVSVFAREDGTRLDKIALVLITPDGGGPGSTDSLGAVAFPSTVQSPSTVILEIPYETTQRRAIQIRLHDVDNGFTTVGQADTTVEAGAGTLSVSVPILAGAREGSGYLWALRLLPVDWTSVDQALAEDYSDASVERNTGGGVTSDLLLSVDVPDTVQPIQTVPVSIEYEATQRRTLAVWLHDLNDNFRTIGFAQATVDPGFGTQTFDIGIVGDARIGDGHLWVVRLLPEGSTDADAALDQFFQDVTVTERTTSLVNFAVLPDTIATQSSIFGGFFEARLAADGNTDGDWRNGSVTHTELETNAWWEIDLGSVKDIDNILVWNRTDCCAERLSPFYVLVSDTPFESQDLDTARTQAGVSSYQVTETPAPTRQVNVNRNGRYVRVQLAGANYLSLAEIEVYGANQGLVNGVTYEYFEGVWDQLPDFDAISPIETGTATNFDLGVANQTDFFAMRFRGCLNVPADGTYTFYTASDDGSNLLIDGNVVVNNDGLHGIREVSGSLTLTAGMHPMEVQFFERTGGQSLIVSWEGNGISKQPIADQFLSVNETGISPGFHHVGRQVAADDNADGDLLDVTAEYALGRDPSVASMNDLGLHIEATEAQLDVWYDRPARLEEIAYTLEYSDDLATWTDILSPTITSESYGTERVRYENLGQLDLVNSDQGFVRLRIKHHAWNHETTTPTCGWYSTTLHEGYQTHGLSLNREPVFGSTLADIEDNMFVANSAGLLESIAPGRSYYVEITSGALEGHRLELNETDSEDQRLAVDWASPLNTLANTFTPEDALDATFVVREHWTLEDAYPSAQLQASTDPVFADQIQFFNGQSQSFESVFVLGDANESFWVANDDNTLASQAGRIIPPGMGYFVKRPNDSPAHTIRLTGHVRESAFIQPLSSGHNLVASPRPLASHAEARGLTIENGFLGSRDPDGADQIQVWKGDSSPGEQGYNSYFLLDAGQEATRYWTSAGDAELNNANEEQVFAHDRAVFIQLTSESHPTYRVPAMP